MKLFKTFSPSNVRGLARIVFCLAVFSAIFTLVLSLLDNEMNDAQINYLEIASILDRFIAKNDIVGVYGRLNNGNVPSDIQAQALDYLTTLKGKLNEIDGINGEICMSSDLYATEFKPQIDRGNSRATENLNSAKEIRPWHTGVIYFSLFLQIATAAFAYRSISLTKPEKEVVTEPKEKELNRDRDG